jgi:hypothetical protein
MKHRSIETQTEGDYEEPKPDKEDDGIDQSLTRGAERLVFQRELTKLIAGQSQIEQTSAQATIHMGNNALSFELDNGRIELAGVYCDAAFPHGDVLDYAAKTNDASLLCYELQARLLCRDAIARDVAQLQGATYDGAWNIYVQLSKLHSATLRVDPNYGTEYGRVKVMRWSALDDTVNLDSEQAVGYRKTLETIHGPIPYTIPQVVRILTSASNV